MYIFPGYVECQEQNTGIQLSSQLLQNTVRITDPTLRAELQHLMNAMGCSTLSTPLTKFLHEQELLVEEWEIDATLGEAKKLLNEDLLLTIMPTESCNFRCPYCYEDHAAISMSPQTLKQIERYIETQAPNFKMIQLAWFGGEPTLCKNAVLETAAFVQSLQSSYSFSYTSGMTTNGYLLDVDTLKQYFNVGITTYQVTLDGWNHDKTRPHVSGSCTLQTILNNLIAISSLPKEEYSFFITLRHNVLADDNDFSWYDYLYELFGHDERFGVFVHPVGDWGGESVKSLSLLDSEGRESLPLAHIEYLKKIGMKCTNGRKGVFAKICYACYPNSMVFRADGRIEKCTVALNHPLNALGFVHPEKGVVLNPEINKLWSSSKLKHECYTCPEVLSCLNLRCKKRCIVDGHTNSRCSRASAAIY